MTPKPETERRQQPQTDRDDHDRAWEVIRGCDERLREIERLDKETRARTRNWREEIAIIGKDK